MKRMMAMHSGEHGTGDLPRTDGMETWYAREPAAVTAVTWDGTPEMAERLRFEIGETVEKDGKLWIIEEPVEEWMGADELWPPGTVIVEDADWRVTYMSPEKFRKRYVAPSRWAEEAGRDMEEKFDWDAE